MGKSKTGGVFGFLSKSVGSVTYSTQKNANGKKEQIVRAKITDMTNPNTVGQILQRMKIKPAQRFYKAINNADSALILDHSFEGVQYGTASMREFMSRALKANGPYIPKNAVRFVPAKYEIADGSIEPVVITVGSDAFTFANGLVPAAAEGATDTSRTLDALLAMAGANTQITFVWVTQGTDGSFTPHVGRCIPDDATQNSIVGLPFAIDDTSLKVTNAVAFASILSRKDASGSWLRSKSQMYLTTTLEANLYGNLAQTAAIESYQDNSSENSVNNQWYLNLANGQPFPGQITTLVTDSTSVAPGTTVVVGLEVESDGSTKYTVFAQADNAGDDAKVATLVNGQVVFTGSYTVGDAVSDLGAEVAKWQPAYALQANF